MRNYPVKRPLCALVGAFCIGLWLGGVSPEPDRMVCAIFLLAALLITTFLTKNIRLVLCLVLLLLAGFCWMQQTVAANQALVPYHGEEAHITAQVTRAPADRTYIDAEVLTLNGAALEKAVPLRIQRTWEDDTDYTVHATYAFTGRFAAPEPGRNPGGYDEAKILFQRGMFTLFDPKESGEFLSPPPAWAEWLNALRSKYNQILSQSLTPGEQALVVATLFGDVSSLNEDFYNASQQFGIIHIFSVSGLHVSFILAFVLVLARLLRKQHSWALVFFMTPLLFLYTLLSDATAPAVRASIMGLAALLAMRLLRYRDALTILALAAFSLLVANPFNLWQIGFQLSFLAMLGLIVLAPRLMAFMMRLPNGLAVALSASLAAECVSLPLVAYYFYQVAPLSTLMNLLVVPLFSMLVPLALVALLLAGFLPFLSTLLFLPVRALILAVVAMMDVVNNLVGTLHFYIGQPSPFLIAAYYLLLIGFVLLPDAWRTLRFVALFILTGAIAMIVLRPAVPDNLRLTMVDVGQGSASIYHSADDHWLVFDTGPGADTTAGVLRYYGANSIDALVLSHSDLDHITGAAHILRDFHVQKLFASAYAQTTAEWEALAPYLKRTEIVTVETPLEFKQDALTLSLTLVAESEEASENSNQVVCRLADNGFSALFPGDTAAENLSDIPWQAHTDALLVPHHGSKNSWDSAFYERLSPDIALASAGANNRYGHPASAVTEGLAALDIPFACTAEDGALSLYVSENGSLWLERYIK